MDRYVHACSDLNSKGTIMLMTKYKSYSVYLALLLFTCVLYMFCVYIFRQDVSDNYVRGQAIEFDRIAFTAPPILDNIQSVIIPRGRFREYSKATLRVLDLHARDIGIIILNSESDITIFCTSADKVNVYYGIATASFSVDMRNAELICDYINNRQVIVFSKFGVPYIEIIFE
jgi:hypothetical protein